MRPYRKLLGTSKRASHPARPVPAVASLLLLLYDPRCSAVACRSAIGRPFLSQFEIRVRLVLAAAAVPPCQLGGDEGATDLSGARLGWTTWLGGGPAYDRSDAMFAVG
jgi:hypothetical protein